MNISGSETPIWSASPSQLTNIPRLITYYICIIFIVVIYMYFEDDYFLTSRPFLASLIGWVVLAWCLAFIILSFHSILSVKYHRFVLTNERFAEYKGITRFFNSGKSLELYKVIDHSLPEPGFGALFKLGKIQLLTNDADQPTINIFGIYDHETVFIKIRELSEKMRMEKKGFFE